MELGVVPGPDFRRLQSGESVVLESGGVVEPEQVMDERRPGRKIVITGDTRPSPGIIEFSAGATVLVHESTFAESERDRALETRHSTAREAAEVAARAGVLQLVLTHVSSRHGRRELLGEARQAFPRVVLPDDLDQLVVPYPEKGPPVLSRRESCGPATQPITANAAVAAQPASGILAGLPRAHVAQGIEHWPPEPGVAGSNPAVGT